MTVAPVIVSRRVGLSEVPLGLRAAVAACVAGLLGLETWAAASGYGLRVTSDTPSLLSVVRSLALHPGRHVSPFVSDAHVASSHATPYTQLLALIWRFFGGTTAPGADPFGLYLFLAGAGMVVTLVLVHAVLVWGRSQAGPRAAWLTLLVLLTLFGPAHVIWAGDLTFHGFLYAAYFPQTLALALLCYTLAALELDRARRSFVLAMLGTAGTFLVDPFTGAVLAALVAARGSSLALRRRRTWRAGSLALLAGFALGQLWPLYSLGAALTAIGVHGPVFVLACAGAPLVARGLERPRRLYGAAARAEIWIRTRDWIDRSATLALATGGLLVVSGLALWEILLLRAGSGDPLVHTNRLALYWVEDRSRWLLMLSAGLAGLVGLVRLGGRRRFVPAAWLGGCLALGVAGILGFHVPVWWRFLLLCQLPLALGTGVVLARLTRGVTRTVLAATLVGAATFKLVTLVALPGNSTYFGTALQEIYGAFGGVLDRPGAVATDPFTGYFVPGATGHHVLSVTTGHVSSTEEKLASQRGYRLLHEYYSGPRWWQAAQEMWRQGVRYVIVDKSTSLAAPTLEQFLPGPTSQVRTVADRRLLGAYFYRNNRVGTLLYDSPQYVVYQLKRKKLWPK